MGKGLAIETSGRVGSVAAFEDGRLLAEETFEHGLANAARLVLTMDALCRGRGWEPRDVNELYISIGPGSFTGLRLAVTVAKTMWLATGVKIVAVPSVRVLACNAPAEATRMIVVLDAKRGQIFTASFERSGQAMRVVEAAHLDTLGPMLERSQRPVWLLGEGIDYHRGEIPDAADVVVTDKALWRARAAAVGELGTRMAAAGEWANAMTLSPLYIRAPEAEEKADAKAAARARGQSLPE